MTIGTPARLLRLLHALMPGAIIGALGVVNRLLPSPDEGSREAMALPGEIFRRGLARSVLTTLGDRAARRYNEEPGPA